MSRKRKIDGNTKARLWRTWRLVRESGYRKCRVTISGDVKKAIDAHAAIHMHDCVNSDSCTISELTFRPGMLRLVSVLCDSPSIKCVLESAGNHLIAELRWTGKKVVPSVRQIFRSSPFIPLLSSFKADCVTIESI